MRKQEVIFREFQAGEFGSQGLFHAPPGSFHAKNLLLSPQGYLYPRPGTKLYPTTGLPAVSSVHAVGWTGVPGRDLFVVAGTTVYWRDSTNFSAAWTAAGGTLTSEPNEQYWWLETQAGIGYLLVPSNGLYRLDLTTSPGLMVKIAAVTGDMAGYAIGVWGERLLIGGWNPARRVYYSAPGDFSSWPAANFFDVGPAPQVRALEAQREHLAIALQDGSWYVMNGSTPATGTIRRVIHPQGTWHFWPNMARILPNDQLYLTPNQGAWPAVFDGVEVREFRHLRYTGPHGNLQGEQNVVPVHLRDEVLFVSGKGGERGEAMLFRNGAWTYHAIGGSIAGGTATDSQGMVFLHDNQSSGGLDRVYRLNMTYEGEGGALPGGAKTGTARGDADSSTPLDAWLELPGWFDETGVEWTVRQVVIHVRKFDIGGGVNNELRMVVDAHQHEQVADVRSTATKTWTEATTSGTAGGVRDTIIWNVGEQGPGKGFQVRFPKIVGLGIVDVVVKLEATADQSRS